jgi:hypothetical protein
MVIITVWLQGESLSALQQTGERAKRLWWRYAPNAGGQWRHRRAAPESGESAFTDTDPLINEPLQLLHPPQLPRS